ncbi:glycosyl hydrolase [Lapillicoccus sp.]|uniref:glycoside hydrolase family 26 protein n=1 Tax=Lapillicoccus sp. TaxID=1909287 RepID=UPI0025F68B18|nr:glycosyl hydrolase [Lapillicoccus sp.]
MTSTSTDPGSVPEAAPRLEPEVTPANDGIVRVSKLNLSLLAFALVSICAGLYLSPISSPLRSQVQQELARPGAVVAALGGKAPSSYGGTANSSRTPAPSTTRYVTKYSSKPSVSPSKTSATSRSPLPSPYGSGALTNPALYRLPGTYYGSLLPSVSVGGIYRAAPTPSPSSGRPSTPTPSRPSTPAPVTTTTPPVTAAKTACWQFAWQQDAQAVYVANLSDPYGLDGAPGPYDSDGIACSGLPVDPSRSPSTPIGQYVPPTASAETKAAIVGSKNAFYGFTQDGLPGDLSMFDDLEAAAGKAPSTVGWYQTFDQTFRGDLVQQSWSRGALPVFTWMPMDSGSGTSYSLSTIIDGSHDDYLRKFAGDIVRTNLPVVIRFGHEMNGSWYGWSAGRTEWNNSPAKYKAAWIHVWQVFQSVGANDNTIWLWSPSRVDNLKPSATNGITAMADDYPGDQYVDWVGASVYLRHAATGSDYSATFGKTISALEAVTTKPIFFAEVGAIETDGTTDEAGLKTTFIHNTLTAFAGDPRIVGFLWNNNVSAQVVDGQQVSNDWRFTSNVPSAQMFAADIAAPRFRTGLNTSN